MTTAKGKVLTLESLSKDVRELAGYMGVIAKEVLKKDGDYDDEYPEMDKMPVEGPEGASEDEEDYVDTVPIEDALPTGDGMEEDDEYDEDEMMMARKATKAKVKRSKAKTRRQTQKGYAGEADVNTDEHDSPFGEKDADLDGNEDSPAGEQGGDSEDETFGPGGMAYSKAILSELKKLTRQMSGQDEGQVISKASVPSGSGRQRNQPEGIITREQQEEAKKRSFRDLNRLREQTGDLQRNLF